MAHGGVRPNAGRPKGVPNKATQAQREAVAESGLMPLDFLLSVMRDEDNDRDTRVDAAHKAAPYCHARLSTTEVSGPDGGPIEQRITRIENVIVDPAG